MPQNPRRCYVLLTHTADGSYSQIHIRTCLASGM